MGTNSPPYVLDTLEANKNSTAEEYCSGTDHDTRVLSSEVTCIGDGDPI